MKEKILKLLRETEGYVSGQQLCETLGVSRTAVWKHIRQLQEEGYGIEAVTRKGYRLTGVPDTVAASAVSSLLQTRWAGHPVRYYSVTDSTNQVAKRLGDEGDPEGTLVIADEQTAGKGRSGRRWATPPGTNIAMTLLLRPKLQADRISMVTLVMGMAVAQAVRKLYGLEATVKWPNDVVIGTKKLSGTLTEMSAELDGSSLSRTKVHYIVIGTGINVNMLDFLEEIRETATSLRLELGRTADRAQLIAEIMKCFEEDYAVFLESGDMSGLREEFEELMVNTGRQVTVLEPGHEYTGTALGINDRGELRVRTGDGSVREVYAGEVSVRGIYGSYV